MRLGLFSLFVCAVLLLLTACAVQAATPAITIEKSIFVGGGNWAFADTPPGPSFYPGGPAPVFQYDIRNSGDVTLANLHLADTALGPITLPVTTINSGLTFSVTVDGTWTRGQNTSTATVTASYNGQTVSASDPANWYGALPSIGIETLTNGEDADASPGPFITVGSPVTWTYVVTNTGDAVLTNVAVTDDYPGVVVSAPKVSLAAGESMTATASGTAVLGQYANTGTVTGSPPAGPAVTASDPSHYFGASPGIGIRTLTNGDDANAAPGPSLLIGGIVTWTYLVTNTGDVPLSGVRVVDDSGTASDPSDNFAPSFISGDTNGDRSLDSTETWTFAAVDSVRRGQYENTATARGTPPGGLADVTAIDPSHYFGVAPAIDLELFVSVDGGGTWLDADTPPGPYGLAATGIKYKYVVTNTGNVPLSGVGSQAGVIGTLAPGASSESVTVGAWASGQHFSSAVAFGIFGGQTVQDEDGAWYFGAAPGIGIETRTNGEGADAPPGPFITVGAPVQWTYVVTNTGNVQLTNVAVTDDQGVAVSAPKAVLQPGESMTATASGKAVSGQYANIGTASGTPPVGPAVTATNPSHHYGNSAPVVDAGADITGATDVPVAFAGAFTDPDDPGTHTIAWTFGDGSTAAGTLAPSHAYAKNGTFTVNLAITDAGNLAGTDSLAVTVRDPPPVASFTANATTGTAPLTVRFHDSSTGFIHTRAWDFGDGGTSTDAEPVHVFAMPGTYAVRLTVTNSGGADTAGTTVTALAPAASFVAEPASGMAPLTVEFTDTSTGWPTAWQWDFGTGTTSDERNPEYTYLQPGTYTVTLVIIAPAGTAKHQATVVVTEVHPPAPTSTVTVTPTLPKVVPLPGSGTPTDPDGDGRYEDVNGNGVADFADIVLYFQQMEWIAANEPLAAFDFNGNGSIDFADLVWLFNHL